MPRKSNWQVELEAGANPLIYHGASIMQLAAIFHMDTRTVKGKLSVLPPKKIPGRNLEVWAIHEAAPYLVKPHGKIEDALRTMNADQLPAHLRKEYWSAKRQEQAYKREEGDLWPTEDVLTAFAEVFKDLRTRLLLLGEAVEREIALPERAREILKGNIDATMEDMRKGLIERWGERPAASAEGFDPELENIGGDDEFGGL